MSPSLIDRLLVPVKPGPIATFKPPPQELAPGVWRLERRLRMPGGLVLPIATAIFRLPSGKLFLHSPGTLDDAALASLRPLGEPSVILAPNAFHHLFVAEYRKAFPEAAIFYAPGLPARVPSLPRGEEVSSVGPAAWEGVVEPLVFGPIGTFSEVVILHRPSGTLVFTDLAFNMRRHPNGFDRIGWRLFGVPPRFGTSRTARFTLLRNARAARPYLARIAEKDFRRILVAHGDPVENDAPSEFHRAFRKYLD